MIWRAVIVFIITFGLNWCAMGQYVSRGGGFEVNEVKGCAPFMVTVTPIAPFTCGSSGGSCAAFYENDIDNEPLITPPYTHIYSTPGVYNLKILRGVAWDSIQIVVTEDIDPAFDVYTCGNYEVSVKINDTNYDEYVINYNDGSPEVTVNSFGTYNYNYGVSTPQRVTVRGRNLNADDNCSRADKDVTPLVSLPTPAITQLEVLDNTSVRLEFNAQLNIQYKLDIATNNGPFQQANTFYDVTVDTIRNLRTDDNYYCFRLSAYDPCNNQSFTSTTICSANFDVSAVNNAMNLTWTTNTSGINDFGLTRTGSDGSTLQITRNGSPFTDTGISCGIEYCYQLISNYSNGSRSISLTKCATGISTDIPKEIQDITAIAGESSMIVEWQTDLRFIPAEFTIEKSINGAYSFYGTSTQQSFADETYQLEDASCYRISYVDVCGNQSPVSLEVCPIRLSGILQKDNTINLTWSPYSGWRNGVAGYRVEKYSEDGQLLRTFEVGAATSYIDDSDDLNFQTFMYVVKATPMDAGLRRAASNPISILKDPNLFYPSAFTPNGDNLNDIFTVFGQYVENFELKIFNRWGELLFTTNNLEEGWDGTFRGNDMPEGTYTFIAHIKDRTGRIFKRSGSVLLLRRK